MFEDITIRKGMTNHKLSKAEFFEEYKKSFYGEKYRALDTEIDALAKIAWKDYDEENKSPITTKAGPEFKDPDYDLSVEWLETRNRLIYAVEKHKTSRNKILIINGSPRNEHSCPSEMSKTYRMIKKAEEVFQHLDTEYELLDLSRVTSDFGKKIHPCKACVSTSMALCHWPCSCYPNHALNQTSDWMAEIYEMWTRAHGIMIITPVHWYQVPSTLKLMIDRLVCADGGNVDPTTTKGKNPLLAKRLEVKGWDFPKHLAGRAYSVVVHGDSSGISDVRRNLSDWLNDLHLIQAGTGGVTESYIGYYGTYAESHHELDKNKNFMIEIETAAASLVRQIEMNRSARYVQPDIGLEHPMQK
ncbi:MAG: flavodoxin family protein [Rhizobacter sp.]|nr:flavodoxin family protein [Bacteriovorax sp.]